MNILLVGHRGTGKTTLASALSQLHEEWLETVDLDALIEQEEERSCAQIISDHEPYFRELERAYLQRVLETPHGDTPHRLIVLGAGCSPIPTGHPCLWLWRDGWEETARLQRARLRPMRPFEEEVAWMRSTREPRWAAAAHARLDIAQGASDALTVRRLSELLLAILQAPHSPTTQKSYLVPLDLPQLERARHDQPLFGLRALELRSDLLPLSALSACDDSPLLASLRTEDPDWLQFAASLDAELDIDIAHLPLLEQSGLLATHAPRRLILSTHPQVEVDPVACFDALRQHADHLAALAPAWREHLVLKVANHPASYDEITRTINHLRDSPPPYAVTYLPQGERFAWLRPWLVTHLNATNYLPVTLHAAHTRHEETPASPAALDLQDWLPHLCSEPPTRFDALLGEPVMQSIGDWWHRMASLREGDIARSYLKIPTPDTLTEPEWRALFSLFEALQLRGLSITSPHKERVASLPFVRPADGEPLTACNTLWHDETGQWLAADTDAAGMRATLEALLHQGIAPGTVAVIGRGGVSHAITRAIERVAGWQVIHHASARQGWGEDRPEQVRLVVNASGDRDQAYLNPPQTDAWVDLHYTSVRTPPPCRVHLDGEVFFEAQAQAQRDLWQGDPTTRS